jgi:hypothetical protein
MAFTLDVYDACPKCRKATMRAVVQLHSTNPNLALQNFECAECGPVRTKILSIKPSVPPAELSA